MDSCIVNKVNKLCLMKKKISEINIEQKINELEIDNNTNAINNLIEKVDRLLNNRYYDLISLNPPNGIIIDTNTDVIQQIAYTASGGDAEYTIIGLQLGFEGVIENEKGSYILNISSLNINENININIPFSIDDIDDNRIINFDIKFQNLLTKTISYIISVRTNGPITVFPSSHVLPVIKYIRFVKKFIDI